MSVFFVVGLKLSCLDPNKTIDLQYLGVRLPLPPPNLPEKGNAASPVGMLDCCLTVCTRMIEDSFVSWGS